MLEFIVGDQVFLKIAPMKGVMRFGKKGKLSPRNIDPFTIIERIGNVAYKLDLPSSMSQVHNVFLISMLRKYIGNPSHVLRKKSMEIKPDLTYEEKSVKILQREIKQLRNKKIPLVKVLWQNHLTEEATWERENEMRMLKISLVSYGNRKGRELVSTKVQAFYSVVRGHVKR
ncbi:uncharacterized protein LOC111389441 [Olea europaea var. sylvestris]|uniref:uncharacterized protein LOC111389441 n=1 Tax=Olea europaea var. sylvestris TaxID=158386 RepID=UPI000C1CF24A|nr:uncharacterized protein LOC111389441 [Olea europaea var. sylvestris]